MQGRLVSKATSTSGVRLSGSSRSRKTEMMMMRRLMVNKASNRAAVYGAKLPVTDTIDREQVEKEINEGKQMKENKIKEVKKTVDSQINKSHLDVDHKLTPPPVNQNN